MKTNSSNGIAKVPTGIEGLDLITRGGLPQGRTTVIQGGAGCGKTVALLQTLAHGVRELNRPAIFVACEESADKILANTRSFGWELEELTDDQFFLLDARPTPDTAFAGDFDLSGMLAILSARVKKMEAQFIAFDSLDFILAFLDDEASVRREVHRLHEWLQEQELTALLTLKPSDQSGTATSFVQFMVDCAITLTHDIVEGVSHRALRVNKYRGSSFEENRRPMLIGPGGIEVSQIRVETPRHPATTERMSSGVVDLDEMLGGGYLRSTSTLLTGAPGTAKTSLCGAFVQACCERGEKTLFIGFDTRGEELVRNLASIGVDLQTHLDNGLLKLVWTHAFEANAEFQLMEARRLAKEHEAVNLVIDPISALGRAGLERAGVERMVSWARGKDLTMLCTSLLDYQDASYESTPIEISTLADNWIHLSYHIKAGERNRGLSIVKARGTSHSNQVREMILGSSGIKLAEVYTAGGEVLMGTLRREKEMEQAMAEETMEVTAENERRQLESEVAALRARVEAKVAQQRALETSLGQAARKRKTLRREVSKARGGRTD
jgi:circadian clock protein KaiC